jgi:3-methylcrotonyl-CoA carboxylase beta subunit
MEAIRSHIDPTDANFAENHAHLEAQVTEFKDRLARAMLGGGDAARARHTSRGKMLVRDRIERLVDPDAPFLEFSALAANGMYDGGAPGAGLVTGIGCVSGPRVRHRRERRHGQGWHLLSGDGEEAPQGAGDRP